MSNFLRHIFKRLTTSKSRPSHFLIPPQLTYLEERITPALTVNTLQDSSATDAFISLREAIDLANNTAGDDTIDFASSLFSGGAGTITLLTASLPQILDATQLISGVARGTLTITGPGASSLTISGDNGVSGRNFRIFNIASGGNLSISGVTVSGANNSSGNGGAFDNFGTLAVSNSTLSGNIAQHGGGFYNSGIATFTNSTISGNSANTGGGAGNIGTLTISNSTISGNSALNIGGALFNGLTGNLTVSNSTLSGNSASDFGGGIYNLHTTTVTNSTISGNSAGNGGGGIYNFSYSGPSQSFTGTLNIANTIIANSTSGGDYSGTGSVILISPATLANNLVSQGSFSWATTKTSAEINLGPLQNNGGPNLTMALLNGSYAINRGNSTISNTAPINGLDQRGFTRFNSDIGSYAYIAPTVQNDVVVAVNTSGQVGLFLSSAGTAITDFHTAFAGSTLTITATRTTGTITGSGTGITIDNTAKTITLDLNTLVNFSGLVIVGNSGLDSVTIGTGGVDLSAVTTGSANQSFTANILGTSNSISALVLTNSIKTKGTAGTYLSAGTINGSGLITTPSITMVALSGIGATTAVSLASQSIAADSSNGMIVINNASASAVTVSSLTTKETNTNLGQLKIIQFAQTGGGSVTLSNVSTVGTAANTGSGEIELSNAGNLTIGAGGVVSDGVSNIYIQATNLGNIILNGNVDTSRGEGAISLKSAGSISGTGALISGLSGRLEYLTAVTGIDVKTQGLDFSNANISTTSGDIFIENTTSINNLPTIAAPGNLTITASGTITQSGAITAGGNVSLTSGQGIVLSNPITATGTGKTVTLTANGGITLAADVTLTGSTVTNSSTIAGNNHSLVIMGNAVVNGAISNIGSYFVSGTTELGASISVTAPITVGSAPTGVAFNPAGTRAYVTNQGGGTVSVIDTATNTVIGSPITVGSGPTGIVIAVNSAGTFAYVTNQGSGTVSVINTATNTVIGSPITVGSAPTGIVIAVNSAGTFAYVTNNVGGTVSVIDTATNIVIGSPITVGSAPTGIAVNPDGTLAYVTNQMDGTVSVINTATNSVTDTITVGIGIGSAPTGVAFNPAGTRAYVTNQSDNTVSVIDTGNNTVIGSPIIVGNYPIGVAFNPAGTRAYVTNYGSGTVSVIDTGNNTVIGSPITVGSAPTGIAVNPAGTRAYVTNQGSGTVSVINLLTDGFLTFDDAVTLTANVTLFAGSGAINITGNIDSESNNNYSLTINNPVNITNSGDVILGGTIGNTQALGALSITGNDISLGNIGGASAGTTQNVLVQTVDLNSDTASITLTGTTYKTTGQQFYNSSALASISGTNIISSYDGTRPITLTEVNSGSTINMTTEGASSNNAAEFTGLLDLNGHNLSIDTTNNNLNTGGNITFNQTVNGVGTLTLNAGSTGIITASGTIGATTPLTGVTITNAASGSFTGSIHTGNLIITDTTDAGIVNFQGDLTVTTGMTIAANGSYNVQMIGFSNTIAGVTTFGNSGSLTFGDAGSDTFNFTGGIIATDPSEINLIGKVTAAGTGVITLGDSNTALNVKNGSGAVGGASTGTIILGNTILDNGVTLTVGTGIANTINMAAVTGTASSPSSNLILNTTGAVTVTGAVGTDIGNLTITNSGGTTFQSTFAAATATITNTTGTVKFEGDLNLTTSLVTAAQGYNVSITGTNNNIAGATSFLNTGTVALGNGTNDSTTFAGGLVITAPSSIAIQGTVRTTDTTMTLGDAGTGVILGANTSLNVGTGNINLDGIVSGLFSLTPITSSPGLTTISRANTNTTTNVTTGVVQINNSTPQTTNFVVSGGTLKGTGAIGNLTATGGIIAPGNSPGKVTSTNLSLSSGNTLQIEINNVSPPIAGNDYDYDQIVVSSSGTVTLSGALTLSTTYTGNAGTVFTIIDNQGGNAVSGTFNGLSEGAVITANGRSYQISYIGGTGSNDVT